MSINSNCTHQIQTVQIDTITANQLIIPVLILVDVISFVTSQGKTAYQLQHDDAWKLFLLKTHSHSACELGSDEDFERFTGWECTHFNDCHIESKSLLFQWIIIVIIKTLKKERKK